MARSKYHNVRTEYNGVKYDSKAEAAYAETLDLMLRASTIRGWIRQPTFSLGVPENKYRPDFLVFDGDGTVYAVDVKGVETRKFLHDAKLWSRYGPCPLHVVGVKRGTISTSRTIEPEVTNG